MQIAIIGAGFSGCQLAIQLLRRARQDTEILLFDSTGKFGRGVAYGAEHARLLLNNRVLNMSPFEDQPNHFLDWLVAQNLPEHPTGSVPSSGHAFVSRRVYGRYLAEQLDLAAAKAPRGVLLRRLGRQVTGLAEARNRLSLTLDNAQIASVDAAVLCTGILPPELPQAPGAESCSGARLIDNPWDEAAIERIGSKDVVLVLGSGLTMVDAAVLLANQGHRGPIMAVSRRGLLPRMHAPAGSWQLIASPPEGRLSTLQLLRHVRSEIRRARQFGVGWRDVLDALRPQAASLWQRLSEAESRRFLRHLRAFWDVHRHRMAPDIAAVIHDLQQRGRLTVRAGTIEAYESCCDGVTLRFRARGSSTPTRLVGDWLINCAGPRLDFSSAREPLLRTLLDQGLARPDRLGMGLAVTPSLRLIGADGQPHGRLFAMGPLTKGTFGEATAVQDIRRQGQAIAEHLLQTALALA